MLKDLCFEIIESCPNRCVFCSSNSCLSKDKIISFSDFKRVIDYFMNNGGIGELSLSGGEPFLHPDLFKMVEYAKSYGIRTVIFTSGIKKSLPIKEEIKEFYFQKMQKDLAEIEKYEPENVRAKNNIKRFYEEALNIPEFSFIKKEELQELKNIGLDKIVFDYQAYEIETDSYLMGRNRERYINLLKSLLHAASSGIEVDVHFIPMKPNYQQIIDILEMLEIADIKNISILKFVPQGRGLQNIEQLELNEEEMEEFKQLLNCSQKIYHGKIRMGIPLKTDNMHKCTAGLEKLDIKFDGTIIPCPAFKELDLETARRYGIKYYNIYDNLEDVIVPGGTRYEPLCRKIYRKNNNI